MQGVQAEQEGRRTSLGRITGHRLSGLDPGEPPANVASFAPWAPLGDITVSTDNTRHPFSTNPVSLRLTTPAVNSTTDAGDATLGGVRNPGYWGINVKPGASWNFSFYVLADGIKEVQVALVDESGELASLESVIDVTSAQGGPNALPHAFFALGMIGDVPTKVHDQHSYRFMGAADCYDFYTNDMPALHQQWNVRISLERIRDGKHRRCVIGSIRRCRRLVAKGYFRQSVSSPTRIYTHARFVAWSVNLNPNVRTFTLFTLVVPRGELFGGNRTADTLELEENTRSTRSSSGSLQLRVGLLGD